MLLVFPFNTQDVRLAITLAKYFEFVGPYKSHELLIAAPNDCESYVQEIQAAIGDQFARVYTHYVTTRQGWPAGPNGAFHSVAYYIWQQIPCDCWYFFEPDNTPLKPNWINTLADEYRRVQRPFMGVIHPTYWRRKNPDGTLERFIQDGSHLVGTSIYPKDAPRYSKLFKSIPYAITPWDVYWQWETIKYASGTNLIHHEWRSFRYKRDKKTGEIKGERAPGGELPYEPKPLSPDAVVHHGCKDGSLLHIMRGLIVSRGLPVEGEVVPAEPVQGNLV
jgi:hypothetical protein